MDPILDRSVNDTLNLKLSPEGNSEYRQISVADMHPPALPLKGSGLKQTSIADSVRKMFGKNSSTASADPSAPAQAEEENEGMNSGLKLFLIVAGVAVAGFVIYKVAKKMELKNAVKSAYKG